MKHNFACRSSDHLISRRNVLGGMGGLALAGIAGSASSSRFQTTLAAELKARRKQVIFIWLDGGISQLESWDPKPNTEFGGPFRTIKTSVPGVHISELMPHTAKQMHHLAVVRSMHTRDQNHSSAVKLIERGDPKNRGVEYPYFGAAVAHFLGAGDSKLPPYVWIKPYNGGFKFDQAGFLGPKCGCLALGDGKAPENLLRNPMISVAADAARQELRIKANERFAKSRRRTENDANSYAYDLAGQIMVRNDLFDESTYKQTDLDRYGRHDLGRHLLEARRLVEAGVTFVKVSSFHWDTHGDNFNLSQSLIPQFDQPFAALIEDLSAGGMLENTLVVAMSEFGRTPRINGHVGRDHWPEAWSVAMAGCGLHRGAIIGETNARGTWVTSNEHDVGHLFHTWFKALGLDTDKLEYDNQGQPLPVANEDTKAIKELLA